MKIYGSREFEPRFGLHSLRPVQQHPKKQVVQQAPMIPQHISWIS